MGGFLQEIKSRVPKYAQSEELCQKENSVIRRGFAGVTGTAERELSKVKDLTPAC